MSHLDLKSLQNQLREVQKKTSNYKLSERTIVDIVNKIIQRGKVKLNFTHNGKEYVTDQKILAEIQNEVKRNQGIIPKLELIKTLDLKQNTVEKALDTLYSTLKGNNAMSLVEGKIVTSYYFNRVIDEINSLLLDKNGNVYLKDLSSAFDFSIQFFRKFVQENVNNGKIKGILYPTRILTESYIQTQKNLIKPILVASLQPVNLSFFTEKFGLDESIVPDLIRECIKDGINGTFLNNVYEPFIYKELQRKYLQGALNQNGYIEYASLSKVGISEPKEFIEQYVFKKTDKGIFLKTIYIDFSLKTRFESEFYENVFNGKITNSSIILELTLTEEDLISILDNINFDTSSIIIIDSNIIPNTFLTNIEKNESYKKLFNKEYEYHLKAYNLQLKEKLEKEKKKRHQEEINKDSSTVNKNKKKTGNKKNKNDKDEDDLNDDYLFTITKETKSELKSKTREFVLVDEMKDVYDSEDLVSRFYSYLEEKLEKDLKKLVLENAGDSGNSNKNKSLIKNLCLDDNNIDSQYADLKLIYKSFSILEKLVEGSKETKEGKDTKDKNKDKDKEKDKDKDKDKDLNNAIKAFCTYYSKSQILNFFNLIYLKQVHHMKIKNNFDNFTNTNTRKDLIALIPEDSIRNIFNQLNETIANKNFNSFITIFENEVKNLAVSIIVNDKKKEKTAWENINSSISSKIISLEKVVGKSSNKNDYLTMMLALYEDLFVKLGLYLPLPVESWSPNLYIQVLSSINKNKECEYLFTGKESLKSEDCVFYIKDFTEMINSKEEFDYNKVDKCSDIINKVRNVVNI